MAVVFRDYSNNIRALFDGNKAKCLVKLGIKWQEIATMEATARGAVDTGRYRASMTYQPDMAGDRVIVGTNVDYAKWIEDGTSKMPARPIVRESVSLYTDDYKEIIQETLGEGF